MIKTLLLLITLMTMAFTSTFAHAKAKNKYQFKNAQLKISLSPRNPEQIAAFYEGRGFSKPMIEKLKQVCFITVGIQNNSKNIIWHDLSSWTFTRNNIKIERYDRTHWKSTWKAMEIPQAHQSTFRWTLLPIALDFRSNEHEGGNITLPYSKQTYTLDAVFQTKKDKSGKPIHIKIENIQCIR